MANRSVYRKVQTAFLLASSLVLLGCHEPTVQPESRTKTTKDLASKSNTDQGSVYDRTLRRFTRAAFLQPDAESLDGQLRWMAPLIVQQMTDDPSTDAPGQRFGALTENQTGQPAVDTERLTVYLTSTSATLNDQVHQQLTYFWFYPPAPQQRRPRWRGFRMTLAGDGFPAIWEVTSSDATGHVIYVSKSLEAAAAARYGPPLAGRRFAVEPSLDKHAEVVVARVLDDGPQPMGPYVYLDRESVAVTTLLCRCMPPQVDDFAANIYYQLVPISNLAELTEGRFLPQDLGLPPSSTWLTTALRLPADF